MWVSLPEVTHKSVMILIEFIYFLVTLFIASIVVPQSPSQKYQMPYSSVCGNIKENPLLDSENL